MESKKQTDIARWALAVSAISLLVTIIMAINQYRENIEVVSDRLYITEPNIENGTISCEIDIIVANTSQSTVSLLQTRAYRLTTGFNAVDKLAASTAPDMPLTLIQGGAEKITLYCQYRLEDTDIYAIEEGGNISDVLVRQGISVRVYSAKGRCYSSIVRFENAIQK